MSNSVQPHRWQSTRLPYPWDSPGKNTGVGCHFLLQRMKVKSGSEVAQSYLTLKWPHGLQPTRLLRPWDFPGKSTGVGCQCPGRLAVRIWLEVQSLVRKLSSLKLHSKARPKCVRVCVYVCVDRQIFFFQVCSQVTVGKLS